MKVNSHEIYNIQKPCINFSFYTEPVSATVPESGSVKEPDYPLSAVPALEGPFSIRESQGAAESF